MLNRPEGVGGLKAMLLGETPLNPPFAKGGDCCALPLVGRDTGDFGKAPLPYGGEVGVFLFCGKV